MKTNTVDIKELLAQHNLTEDEYKKILEILGREPNLTELGMFSVMWSEHCSYKSSRVHLKKLPTTGPRVVQGPGENAGAVDIGDGLCVVFKMESHNHPSFIEPYQGAATGVGGILRDVFTMGARPIALLDSLRFGGLDSAQESSPDEGRCGWDCRLRQLHGGSNGGWRSAFRRHLLPESACECLLSGRRAQGQDLSGHRRGCRQPRHLLWLEDGPRRDPRRHDGVRRIR